MKHLAVLVVLLIAGAARAEVSSLIPGPPRDVEIDDSPLGFVRRDLRMERDKWIELLKDVKGAVVSQYKQQAEGNCLEDVERKLKVEGYTILDLKEMPIELSNGITRDQLVRQAVNALQGYADKKYAVKVVSSLIIACAPKPGLTKEQRERNLVEFLSGVAEGNIGNVKAYMIRQFDKPVGMVCVEIVLNSRGDLDSVLRLIELSMGAFINNNAKEFEQQFGPALEEFMKNPPGKQPDYQWGR